MQRKLPDLSTTQLIASGVATAVAAVGASYLGVYGTIIGAAFMSVVSTAGAAVGKHYLDQGKEQIKERAHLYTAAEQEEMAKAAAAQATSANPTQRTMALPPETLTGVQGQGDPNATALDPNATRLDSGVTRLGSGVTRRDGLPVVGDPNATRLDGVPAETAVAGAVAGENAEEAIRRASWKAAFVATLQWARDHWKGLALSSVMIFAVVMGGLTIAEKITNKPVSGWVGQNQGTGTTWNNLGRNEQNPAPTPTREPTRPTGEPSTGPSTGPTGDPANPGGGTGRPTDRPTTTPTDRPTTTPTTKPTTKPSPTPTSSPTTRPDDGGSDKPESGQGGAGGDQAADAGRTARSGQD